MRYNLGCGADYRYGWVNCDKYPEARPDLVMDLEAFPWPIEDDAADEILLSHVIEHLGGHSDVFLGVMKELYRVCRPGARIVIRVPDPRHDDYLSDPTHQRPVLPSLFQPFDLALNERWQAMRLPGTPLGKYLGIDLPTVSVSQHLDPRWMEAWQSQTISDDAMAQSMRSNNNVVQWSEIVLEARKPFAPGRSLETLDALVVRRLGGLGDVIMALSALSAVHRSAGVPVYLETSADFADLAAACPQVAGVFTEHEAMLAFFQGSGMKEVRFIDWSPALYGISRLHQVDAFLGSLGVTLPDGGKAVEIAAELPPNIARLIDDLPKGCRKVVLHPGMTDPNRTWPRSMWQALADDLVAAGDAVVVVGRRGGADGRGVAAIDHPTVLDLTDLLSPRETIALLRRCDALVSGDAGPIQLAGASDIAIVGLYSVVAGRNRMPFRTGAAGAAVAIAPSCAFHPCYPRINDPEEVARFCAGEGMSPDDTPALFARWCVNPDRHACLREPDTLGRITAALASTEARRPAPPVPARPADRVP